VDEFFKFYADLAKHDYDMTNDRSTAKSFTKCLEEESRFRLENSILPKAVKDL
jgi:hypothetical protein